MHVLLRPIQQGHRTSHADRSQGTGPAARYGAVGVGTAEPYALMAFKKNILVIANVTATSDELCSRLIERANHEPAAFTILVPATSAAGGHAAAQEQLEAAIARLRGAGLEASGSVGHPDPIVATSEIWDPRHYDEIVISTLPIGASKWLHAGLPERISKLTGSLVTHIVSDPPRHADTALGPLTVLGWGGRHTDKRAPDART
jgi:hypothetical protein